MQSLKLKPRRNKHDLTQPRRKALELVTASNFSAILMHINFGDYCTAWRLALEAVAGPEERLFTYRSNVNVAQEIRADGF
jgi:hypothetical protein